MLAHEEEEEQRQLQLQEPERLLGPPEQQLGVEGRRWYILFVFSLLSATQCIVWFTYSCVPAEAMEYYGMGEGSVALLLNWGSMVALALSLPMLAHEEEEEQRQLQLQEPERLLGPPEQQLGVEGRRWYILFVFSLLSATQCIVWFTYSCVPAEAMEYYGMGEGSVALLLNWGSMVALALSLPVAWLLSARGLRPAVLAAAALVLATTLARLFPCLVRSPGARARLVPLLHAAQTLNGAAAPVVLSAVALVASTWFPEGERATATAVAVLSNSLGMPAAFLLGPALVPRPSAFPRLVYATAALAALPFALVCAHFPAQPALPPSPAAAEARRRAPGAARGGAGAALRGFAGEVGACLRTGAYVGLLGPCGVQAGVLGAFTAMLQLTLGASGWSTAQAGWVGFAMTAATIAGSLAAGRLTDRWLRRRMKAAIACSYALMAAVLALFLLSVPSVLADRALLPVGGAVVGAELVLLGLLGGTVAPVVYELCAEVTYPVPEGTSTTLVTMWGMLCLVALLFAAPRISAPWWSLLGALTCAACAAATLLVKEEYKRQDVGRVPSAAPAAAELQHSGSD
eukprot:m51a1_g11438 hypothetical protein (573) ;mRNA; r:19357-21498